MADTRSARQNAKKWIALAAIALFATLGTFILGPHIQGALKSATTPKPEYFTELYFDDHLDLPKQVDVGTTYAVPFTLVNHEGSTKEYSYQVTVSQNGEIIQQTTHTTALHDNGQTTLNLDFTPRATDQTYLVTVSLAHNNQSIHFRAQS